VLESYHNLYHISAVDILFLLSFYEHADIQELYVARSELKGIKINNLIIFCVFLIYIHRPRLSSSG
jgi:hypothetical protein